MVSPIEIAKRQFTLSTGQIRALPLVTLMPHSRCDCRCVMCDIWKSNESGVEISEEVLTEHLKSLRRLRVRRVVLSGGEPLMHSNLWRLCEMLRRHKIKLSLISSGILLKPNADEIVKWFDEIIVSLDGSPAVHDRVRGIQGVFEKLDDGIRAVRSRKPKMRITARCVLQRRNYFDLGNIIETARRLGVDEISFIAADVTSDAFGHEVPWVGAGDVRLTPEETIHFQLVIDALLRKRKEEFSSGFVVGGPERIKRILRYYRALNDQDSFPEPSCNAPWVSTVIEADGSVRPCTFHQPIGNIHQDSLENILNGEVAVDFRNGLDMSDNPICRRCVSSIRLNPFQRS